MKIEVSGISKPGYLAFINEDGKMIEGITNALIDIRPDRMPTILIRQIVFEDGQPIAEGDHVKEHFVIYYPGEFSMEA